MSIWRVCDGGIITTGIIPERWLEIRYTGVEGGNCYEPVELEFSENSVVFEKVNYTPQPFQPKEISVKNTSNDKTYMVTFNTDDLFRLSVSQMTILPRQELTLTVTLPPENEQSFRVGKTKYRLQVDVIKI